MATVVGLKPPPALKLVHPMGRLGAASHPKGPVSGAPRGAAGRLEPKWLSLSLSLSQSVSTRPERASGPPTLSHTNAHLQVMAGVFDPELPPIGSASHGQGKRRLTASKPKHTLNLAKIAAQTHTHTLSLSLSLSLALSLFLPLPCFAQGHGISASPSPCCLLA